MDFGLTAVVISLFTVAIGIAFFFLSTRASGFGQVAFFAGGAVFIILTLMNIPVMIVDTVEYGNEPPCEWLINESFANSTTEPVNASSGHYGEMFHYNAVGTTQTVGVANSWIEIRVFQAGNLNNVTFDTADDTLAPTNGDVYAVEWSLSFAGGVSDEYKIAPFVNNVTELTRCNQHRKLGTGGDVGSASGSCLWSFSANDTIGLKVQNIGDTNNIDVYGANLNIVRLVGSLFEEGQQSTELTNFSYYNSCDDRSVPATITTVFTIYTWLIWAALAFAFFGGLAFVFNRWRRRV